MTPPQLVIFDCDGVLVDSETLGNRAISETVGELGGSLTIAESTRLFRGVKMDRVVRILEERLERRLPASFVPELRERMAALFRTELSMIEGVEQLLDQLSIPTCVTSNAPVEKLQLTLSVTGLLPRFEGRIFSAYEVGVWKPDPGLYLYAAEAMRAAPESCVVVEDSIPGVEAGVAAGMRVFGFDPTGDGTDLAARGAVVFSSMSQLLGLIGVATQ
jgi:HAD superfamily hydrolase (TIGR01509 family)